MIKSRIFSTVLILAFGLGLDCGCIKYNVSGPTDAIVYTSLQSPTVASSLGGSYNLWVTKSDGSNNLAVTQNVQAGLDVLQPIFTPNGNLILFYSLTAISGQWDGTPSGSYNIWAVSFDPSRGVGAPYPLTRNTISGANSEVTGVTNGKIYFQSTMALSGVANATPCLSNNIWSMNTDGSGLTPITMNCGAGFDSTSPRVSANGSHIVFASLMNVNGSSTLSTNIWTANGDGSNMQPLTQNTAAGLNSANPDISSDGSLISYQSTTAMSGAWNGSATAAINIWVAQFNGSQFTPITQTTTGVIGQSNAAISRDGQHVTFQSNLNLQVNFNGAAGLSTNVWIANTNGTGLAPLTQNTLSGYSSAYVHFSADSTKAIYSSMTDISGAWNGTATAQFNLWVSNLDGSNRRVLNPENIGTIAHANSQMPWVNLRIQK